MKLNVYSFYKNYMVNSVKSTLVHGNLNIFKII